MPHDLIIMLATVLSAVAVIGTPVTLGAALLIERKEHASRNKTRKNSTKRGENTREKLD